MSFHAALPPSTSTPRPSTTTARGSVSDNSVLRQQRLEKDASKFGTVPTGRPSPPHQQHQQRQRKPSHAILGDPYRAPASRTSSDISVLSTADRRASNAASLHPTPSCSALNQPIQFSLNLVMNIQPINGGDGKCTVEPVGLRVNGANMLGKAKPPQQPQQHRTRQPQLHASPHRQPPQDVPAGYQSDYEDNNEVFVPSKSPAQRTVQAQAKSTVTGEAAKMMENVAQQQQNVLNALSDSRASHGSTKDGNKTPVKTPESRLKNKKSLLKFRSLEGRSRKSVSFSEYPPIQLNFDNVDGDAGSQLSASQTSNQSSNNEAPPSSSSNFNPLKPRSKSVGTALQQPTPPRPHNSSFYETIAQVGSTPHPSSFHRQRSKSTGTELPGFKPYPRPQPLNFDDSTATAQLYVENEGVKTFPQNKSFQNSLGMNDVLISSSQPSTSLTDGSAIVVVPCHRSISTCSLLTAILNETVGRRSLNNSLNNSLDSSIAFSDCSPKRIACDLHVGQPLTPGAPTPVYNHQRQFRIGFLANNVQMAVNVVLNIRSEDEFLYLKPVELLYEGDKIWRASARQIAKEMKEKMEADKIKKNLSTTSVESDSSFVTAPTGPTPHATPKAASRRGTPKEASRHATPKRQ